MTNIGYASYYISMLYNYSINYQMSIFMICLVVNLFISIVLSEISIFMIRQLNNNLLLIVYIVFAVYFVIYDYTSFEVYIYTLGIHKIILVNLLLMFCIFIINKRLYELYESYNSI